MVHRHLKSGTSRIAVVGAIAAGLAVMAAPAWADPADGRHWELLTGAVAPSREVVVAYPDRSPGADAVMYAPDIAQPSSAQGGPGAPFVARRTSSGWVSIDASLPGSNAASDTTQSSMSVVRPPDLSRIVTFSAGQPDPSAPSANPDLPRLFITTPGSRTGRSLLRPPFQDTPNVVPVTGQQTVSSVYLRPEGAGGAGDPPLEADDGTVIDGSVFGRSDEDGSLSVASRLPDGSVSDRLSLAESTAGVRLYGFSSYQPTAAVSTDGRRFFFYAYVGDARQTQPVDAEGGPLQPLFVRDGDARTVALSQSELDGQAKPARFLGASPDGDVVYFVSNEALDADHEGGGVYRYQLSAADPLTRLTPSVEPQPGVGATIDDLQVGSGQTSGDGSAVYFVTAADMGGGAQPGGRNAYAFRNGQLRFITDLGPDGLLSSVSPDGAFAVFRSSTGLAGADTGGFAQLYRYAHGVASGDRLRCVSCRPDGAASQGPSNFSGLVSSLTARGDPARGLSVDGRVFFTAQDRLVNEDQGAGQDVYEYTGSGLRMLSDGAGVSQLADTREDGRSIYVATASSLVPEDRDAGSFDIYARRGGSDIERPAVSAPCRGEACQGAPATPFSAPLPGSLASGGEGNRPTPRPVAATVLGRPSLSAGARRTLARGARASMRIRVRGQGRITVRGTARVGSGRRVVASGSATGRRSASRLASVAVVLNGLGRRELARRGTLTVRLEVRFGSKTSRTTTVTLRRAG